MRHRVWIALVVVGLALALGAEGQAPTGVKSQVGTTAGKDEKAIRQGARAFAEAYNKKDSRLLADMFASQGELEDHGIAYRGRAAIEKGFAALFKEKPNAQIEIQVESIRMLSPDCAIEEGLIRQKSDGRDLPGSSVYTCIHIREQGEWKIAQAREWGAGQDRLEDLDWLLGTWKGTAKDREFSLEFSQETGKPVVLGKFVSKANGKPVAAGTIRIALDRQRRQLRSWQFDDDGGHAQSLWIRDGNRWALDTVGATADGANTACVNILARVKPNELTWRTIDRVVAGEKVPDTAPLKLTRQETK
jgi:uncharacterized protein (TIGR02246 family)